MIWLVDGNNVMGSRPDGWWHDRTKAARRLSQEIAEWCRRHADQVIVVFDGQHQATVTELSGGNLEISYAPGRRDAADDEIVARAGLLAESFVVVTADKGLIARLPETASVLGPSHFLDTVSGS